MIRFTSAAILAVLLISCGQEKKQESAENPPAEGFNKEASDQKAIAIADSVMKAMGGRKNYDALRYVSWNFFGKRDLVWDKQAGRVRIDEPSENIAYLLDIETMEGRVQKGNVEITDPDSLKVYLQKAYEMWINDSYWLVMPFKLKDTGVTLKYVREDVTQKGIASHVLSMTFDNVGITPGNKYEVYVDKADHLVRQWAFFKNAAQDKPSAIWPWDNYLAHKGVLFSSDRSDGKGPRNVRVFNEVPDQVFTDFDKPAL